MGKLRDLTGQVFGRLTVTNQWRHQPVGKRHCIFCLCRCSCGSPRKWIRSQDLVNGRTTSCGCVHRELLVDRTLKHGHARAKQRSKTYASWERMWNKNRIIHTVILDAGSRSKNHGGRISQNSLKTWANARPARLSTERITMRDTRLRTAAGQLQLRSLGTNPM